MRAVWYDRQGPAEQVLVTGDLPTPEPALGQVRVQLEASGVNPSDTYRRRGAVPAEYPRVIPNSDGAGVVDKVGDGVPASWIGRRVWLYNGQRNGRWMGTAAEYIALDADLVTAMPDHVSFAQGATLGIPAMTAHGCVFAAGPVQGRTLLITGGAGAVGHYAVQLAAWAGARVIATVSSDEKGRRAAQGGAEYVINYRTEDVAARVAEITGGEGVDHVVDVDLGGNLAATDRQRAAPRQHRLLRDERGPPAGRGPAAADGPEPDAPRFCAAHQPSPRPQTRPAGHRRLGAHAGAHPVGGRGISALRDGGGASVGGGRRQDRNRCRRLFTVKRDRLRLTRHRCSKLRHESPAQTKARTMIGSAGPAMELVRNCRSPVAPSCPQVAGGTVADRPSAPG